VNVWYYEYKLDLYSVAQHTGPVSSNSPQKELDFKPASGGLFFRLYAAHLALAMSPNRHAAVMPPSPAASRIFLLIPPHHHQEEHEPA
jgi:hypothetical protein